MSSKIIPYKLTVSSEPWEEYVEYLRSNVFDEDTHPKDKTAALIRWADDKTFQLMKRLCHPSDPHEKSFDALAYRVGDCLDKLKQREIIHARQKFYDCIQQADQRVSMYAATLERLIARCYFQQSLEMDILKKKLILGLRNVEHRNELCGSFSSFTYEETVKIAAEMEKKERMEELKTRLPFPHPLYDRLPIIGPKVTVERVEQLSDFDDDY